MRTINLITKILEITFVIFFCSLCTPKTEKDAIIENTLKSVSLFYDTAGVDPSAILASLERVNKAIDSIGYPDAGYKLWIVQSDTFKNYRFMLEGYWPDQEIYDLIHNHELYKNASKGHEQEDEKIWNNLDNISYNRFMLVK